MPPPDSMNLRDDSEEAVRVRAWLTEVSRPDPKPASKPPPLPNLQRLRKRFVFRCGLLSVTIIALFLDHYRHGINLDTTGLLSSTFLLILALPTLFCLALVAAVQMLRAPFGSKPENLWILLSMPAAFIIPNILNVPDLADGAAQTLRKLNISDELVAAVADEIKKPGADTSRWRLEWDQQNRILSTYPFSKVGLKYAPPRFHEDSLLFETGSPISDRWGFSISAVKGRSPHIPENCSDLRSVSKEIVVFHGAS